jgi:hypothetical protein
MSHESFPDIPEEVPLRDARMESSPPQYDLLGSIEFGERMTEERFDAIVAETLRLCNGVSKLDIIRPILTRNEQGEIKTCIKEMLTNSTRVDDPTDDSRRLLEIRVGYSEAPNARGEKSAARLVVGFSDSESGFPIDTGREVVAGEYDDEDISELSQTGRGSVMLKFYASALYHSPYTDSEGRIKGKTVWFEYDLSEPRMPLAPHEEPDPQGPYL